MGVSERETSRPHRSARSVDGLESARWRTCLTCAARRIRQGTEGSLPGLEEARLAIRGGG